ncbi:MAG: diaminopimelate decarboxylase [Vicingaceae bacterium]
MSYYNSNTLSFFEEKETPFYFYDLALLEETLKQLNEAVKGLPYHVHYAIKANANPKVLKKIKQAGLGIDTVSGNEILCALEHGFKGEQIAFAGVGKSDKEIAIGLEHDIFTFNVESLEELKVLDQMAKGANKMAKIAIRLNPNINAKTHHYITTGLEENKFGINYWELAQLFELLHQLEHIELKGLHFHIGSQIRDLGVFKNLCNRVNELQAEFKERNIELEHINVGGGLGVNYQDPDQEIIPDFKSFFEVFENFIDLLPTQQLHFELGRALVAQCASLISRVLFIKKGIKTNFAILDAGMTELIRPALYQSFHKIENLSQMERKANQRYDVVGPICESSDCFGKAILLPESKRGDLFAIRSAGAYGEVMSSSYNLREKAEIYYDPEVG